MWIIIYNYIYFEFILPLRLTAELCVGIENAFHFLRCFQLYFIDLLHPRWTYLITIKFEIKIIISFIDKKRLEYSGKTNNTHEIISCPPNKHPQSRRRTSRRSWTKCWAVSWRLSQARHWARPYWFHDGRQSVGFRTSHLAPGNHRIQIELL